MVWFGCEKAVTEENTRLNFYQKPIVGVMVLLVEVFAIWMTFMSVRGTSHAGVFEPSLTQSEVLRGSDGNVTEEWGYVDARRGVHIFYWFYHSTHPDGYEHRPWIIWLQGGPGLSSVGIGNFVEIGPFDHNLRPRNNTWVQTVNVLFVDSPVGAGFSYADDRALWPTGEAEISSDLITLIKVFLHQKPVFKSLPLYIFGQSYGGKMAVSLGYHLSLVINQTGFDCNLQGVATGNGWVSPFDFIRNYGPLLYQMSLTDGKGLHDIESMANYMTSLESASDWETAGRKWTYVNRVVSEATDFDLDWYNILSVKPPKSRRRYRRGTNRLFFLPLSIYDIKLHTLMNIVIRTKLKIIPDHVRYKLIDYSVFDHQRADFMKPVFNKVSWLLNNTNVNVIVYSGQLDLICNTAGNMQWTQRLDWPGIPFYNDQKRIALIGESSGVPEMFVKSHGQFYFYWILGAGHAVPSDRPETALRMIERIVNGSD